MRWKTFGGEEDTKHIHDCREKKEFYTEGAENTEITEKRSEGQKARCIVPL